MVRTSSGVSAPQRHTQRIGAARGECLEDALFGAVRLGRGILDATNNYAHARAKPGGQPLQVVAIGELVESVEQDHDAALARVIAEPLREPETKALKSRFGSCPSCCSAGHAMPLRSSSSQQPFDERVGRCRTLRGPDEVGDDEVRRRL